MSIRCEDCYYVNHEVEESDTGLPIRAKLSCRRGRGWIKRMYEEKGMFSDSVYCEFATNKEGRGMPR